MRYLPILLEKLLSFGPRSAALRLDHEVKRRSGWLACRARSRARWTAWTLGTVAPGWSAASLLQARQSGQRLFFFGPGDAAARRQNLLATLGPAGRTTAMARADQVLQGLLPYFGSAVQYPSFPPNWFLNPLTGQRVAPSWDWTRLEFDGPDLGDLKLVLEPSRFLFTYDLCRAYWLTAEERYAEGFWVAVENWLAANPPLVGPLWVCGQECALRMLAWSFGLHGLIDAAATTPARVEQLTALMAAHGFRVEQTVGYARSQRNNHLLSEAIGLWSAALLFPELKAAARWHRLGASLLQEAILDQFAPDGSYAQHSFNYQRMALQLAVWALRLGETTHQPWSAVIYDRVRAGLEFIIAVVDHTTGRAPNYGHNDGTLILPLSTCSYDDFRPVLQAAAYAVTRPSPPFAPGPWDEASVWLANSPSRSVPPIPTARLTPAAVTQDADGLPPPRPAPDSGYLILGGRESWAMVRCARYRRRPAHADQLHVDLWWRGLNLACDAGTYLYNGAPPWDNALAGTASHNTVTVDFCNQMVRGGRFLWLRWAQGTIRHLRPSAGGLWDYFEGEHAGYQGRRVLHRRAVQQLGAIGWLIVDDLLGAGSHHASLHWLLPDLPLTVQSRQPFSAVQDTPQGPVSWFLFASTHGHAYAVRAGQPTDLPLAPMAARLANGRGWQSPTYARRNPVHSLVYDTWAPLPLRLVTLITCQPLPAAPVVETVGDALSGLTLCGAPGAGASMETLRLAFSDLTRTTEEPQVSLLRPAPTSGAKE